ncbi:MAG TPA: TonB-dependent receptor [Gemmatimonadaceae bacterium]|jgi:TonB-linked SusC/RagA family outer membrane protein
MTVVHRLYLSLVIGLLAAAPLAAQAPTGTITGRVVDSATQQPLADVNVVVQGTQRGAVTGPDGTFTIGSVPVGSQILRARRVGFNGPSQTIIVPLDGIATAEFALTHSVVTLEDVVTVGYGTQARRDVTGSIASVGSKDIETIPVPRVEEAISGLVPGVQVQTTNTQPGSELRIRIRGGNSLSGDNSPLVVVDGVIGADLNQISPTDIASVDILKDASATAIYGARASNGVILVTTKRGQPGKMRFEYNGYTGSQNTTKHIDLLTADQFALLYMRNPNHDKSITFDTTQSMPTTDWQNVLFQSAPVRSNEIAVSGSTGGTSLLASGTMFSQGGIVRQSDFSRGTLRFNVDQDVGSRVRLGTRVTFSRAIGNAVRVNDGYGSAGGPITMSALRFAPTIPVYDSLGNYSSALLPSQQFDNPLAIANLRDNKTTTDYLLGSLFGEYDIFSGLTFRSSVGYTSRNNLQQQYTSRLLLSALNQGHANVANTDRNSFLAENTLTLRRSVGEKNEFTLLGGFTAQSTRNGANSEDGIGFTSDLLGYNRLNLAQTITGTSSSSLERLLSWIGRANLNLAGRYLLTGTIRADGSSKFAANNKWAYFPSMGLAWRLGDETFFRRMAPAVSDLKLRLSTGRTGSEAISPYQSLASWSIGSAYAIGKVTYHNGANPSRNANPNLKWETTNQFDYGMDLGLFENQVSFTADVYKKRTYDLLYAKQVPYYTGFESFVTNVGSVQNHGMELSLDTHRRLGSIEVQLGGNYSLNRSKVLNLGGDKEFLVDGVNSSLPRFRPAAIVRVGEPLGNFYGYVWNGIFQNQAEVAASGQAGAVVGGMKLKDISGPNGVPDGIIDTNDRTILGNAQPKYIFGQTGSFGYRALSLNYVLRGAKGFKIANLNRQGMESPGGGSNMLPAVLNYWSATNPTNSMTGLGIDPYDGMTSRWLEDGSFVRLQNVTLSWDIPRSFASRIGSQRLRMYLSGQNLRTWTKYSWYDPEVSSRGTNDTSIGWDDSSYPGIRTFTFGMNVGF